MEKITAMLLLMGGKSSRMGTSKAWLLYQGIPFWKKIAAELEACGPLYLSVARNRKKEGECLMTEQGCLMMTQNREPAERTGGTEKRMVTDEVDGIGPMGGIYSAMRQIEEPSFFVCACDMPLMSRHYVEALLKVWRRISVEEEWDGLMVRSGDGRIYTTAGIYHKRMLPRLEKQICQENYRMMGLLRGSRICYLEEESLGNLAEALTNVNTMEDYRRLSEQWDQTAASDGDI